MMSFLNWTIESGFAITSPQLIAYRDEQGNVTNLPLLQFVATSEDQHPVIYAVDHQGVVIWKTAYRECVEPFKFAMEQVEDVFRGCYEDSVLRHDMLNSWANEILTLDKELKV